MWILLSAALAEPLQETSTQDAAVPLVSIAEHDALRLERDRLENAVHDSEAARAQTEMLLAQLTVLQQKEQRPEARAQAVRVLGELGDPRALPFLRAETGRSQPSVRLAIIEVVRVWPEEEDAHAITRFLLKRGNSAEVRQAGLLTLQDSTDPRSPAQLEAMAFDVNEDEAMRQQVLAILSQRYPEHVITTAQAPTRDYDSALAFGVSNAIVAGSTLAFVGAIGGSESGTAIGSYGGGLVGLGTGGWYALNEPVPLEGSLNYAGSVGWGGYVGLQTYRILEAANPSSNSETDSRRISGLLSLGTTTGAAASLLSLQDAPSLPDQLERHASGFLGHHFITGLTRARLRNHSDSPEPQQQALGQAGLAGSAIGLGVGHVIRKEWTPDDEDLLFGGLGATYGLWGGGLIPTAISGDANPGWMQAGTAGGASLALIASELRPVSAAESKGSGYGWVSGNLIGVGLGISIAEQCCDSSFGTDTRFAQTVSSSVLVGGTLGAASGFAIGPHIELTPGDQGLIALGTVLSTSNSAALGYVASKKWDFDNTGPVTSITAGAALPAVLAISQFVDPEVDQVLLSTAAVGWGMWYGALTPIALGVDGDEADLVLTTTISADLMLAGSIIAMSSPVELDPQKTVIPQLSALTGATLGALGVALFVDDEQAITAGALGGSLAGFAGGSVLEAKHEPRFPWMSRNQPTQRTHRDIPGIWTPAISPTVLADGEPGMRVALSVTDW